MTALKLTFKNDRFKKSRGGYSRLLDIYCESCGQYLFYYQKDGPGIIKRLYLDRIYQSEEYQKLENKPLKEIPQLICPSCRKLLGMPYLFQKEKRPAFRMFVGAITKKIVKSK